MARQTISTATECPRCGSGTWWHGVDLVYGRPYVSCVMCGYEPSPALADPVYAEVLRAEAAKRGPGPGGREGR